MEQNRNRESRIREGLESEIGVKLRKGVELRWGVELGME